MLSNQITHNKFKLCVSILMQKNDVYCEKMSTNSFGNHRIKIHLQLQNVAENFYILNVTVMSKKIYIITRNF